MRYVLIAWNFLSFLWKYLRPIYGDLMDIVNSIRETDLDNSLARAEAFQQITDIMQLRGMEKIPDSVLNTCIELAYQISLWQNKKGATA